MGLPRAALRTSLIEAGARAGQAHAAINFSRIPPGITKVYLAWLEAEPKLRAFALRAAVTHLLAKQCSIANKCAPQGHRLHDVEETQRVGSLLPLGAQSSLLKALLNASTKKNSPHMTDSSTPRFFLVW